jgi:HEAT repeat protein
VVGMVDWEVVMADGRRTNGNHQPATLGVSDSGAPVRDAVLAGHRGDADAAAQLAGHDDPAVRAAALAALQRAGALEVDRLVGTLSDPAPVVRRRACLVAGPMVRAGADRGPIVAALGRTVSTDADASVVESAAWALGEAGPACGSVEVQALCAVASTHADALCREAAVAALGAIGDPAALDTVLGATDDVAAVRRRATIALAAFEGPAVDDALAARLNDRDWQVRQAAEDLLGRDAAHGDGEDPADIRPGSE